MLTIQRTTFLSTSLSMPSVGKRLTRLDREILVRFEPGVDNIAQENARIANELAVDEQTVAARTDAILAFFRVQSRDKAFDIALHNGIISELTFGEMRVLPVLAKPNKTIVEDLDGDNTSLCLRTVEKHIEVLLDKFNAKTRTEIVLRAIQANVLRVDPFDGRRPTARITEKQLDTLACMHMRNDEIAEKLEVKRRSIESRIEKVFQELDCTTRTEAFIKGIQLGLIAIPMPTGKLNDMRLATGEIAA